MLVLVGYGRNLPRRRPDSKRCESPAVTVYGRIGRTIPRESQNSSAKGSRVIYQRPPGDLRRGQGIITKRLRLAIPLPFP
jgi:hypothetical protein